MRDYEADVDRIILMLEGKTLAREHQAFKTACQWLAGWPAKIPEIKKQLLITTMCGVFEISESELLRGIVGSTTQLFLLPRPALQDDLELKEEALRAILPKGGWFEWYDNFTMQLEVPLSFQISASLVALGAAIGRRAYLDWAHWKIYPNYCSILIGPTGRVHKTVACDIAMKLITEAVLCPVMADKMTPEKFIDALVKTGGQQFIYAPEFTVLFNRQRYNDGFVTSIIRMLDCPDKFEVGTMTRGDTIVENVALSVIGGSTLSLLMSAAPGEVMSSGFLNRFVLVVEDDTARDFPVPGKDRGAEKQVLEALKYMKTIGGEYHLTPASKSIYEEWYHKRKQFLRDAPNEATAEILQRMHTSHILKIALLMHMVACDERVVCVTCMENAIKLVEYYDRHVPKLVAAIQRTSTAVDADYILDVLTRMGGTAEHSTMIRKTSHRFGATMFKQHMNTLVEGGKVIADRKGALTIYVLKEEGV